jgi:bifunctional DNA-binding transcriptional regulator/antitoxin component of YhaV-PrlF toxin-antitoxin module
MEGTVQECGCIALPEALQAKIGLYPGATFEIEVTPDGTELILTPLKTCTPSNPKPGIKCG